MAGFYASEVYASAISKPFAVQQAGLAFDQYVKAYYEEMGYWPLIQDYFNEEGLAETQIAKKRSELLEEAEAKFQFMGSAAILTRN
jgi:hypothetical protein